MEFQLIGQHSDVVNDISFDFYGRRFATCSSDKHIRIWDLKEDSVSDGYNCPATFTNGNEISGANLSNLSAISTSHGTETTPQAHQALQLTSFDIPSAHQNAIWRLSWAHPEYGQLLASCSDDHTICIWEEIEVITRVNNATKKSLEEAVTLAAPSPAKAKTAGGKPKPGGGVGAEGSAGGATITGTSASNAAHIASAAADGGATAADTDAAGSVAATGASGAAVASGSAAAAESKSDTTTGKGEAGAAVTASSVKSEILGKITFQGAVAKPAAAPVTQVVHTASSRSRWTKKAQLSESKKAVRDVKFAPRHLGLMLASVSADGFVRIYEATDVFSLNIWQLQHTVQVEQMVDVLVVDIASSTSSSATGVSGTSSAATVPSSGPIFGGSLDVNNTTQASSADVMGKSEQGLTCVSWNTCPFEPAKIAVGGYSSRAVVLSLEESKWTEECVLGEHSGVVHDIAWAPTMGRNYHQIATASREPAFRIHTLNRAANGSLEYRSSQTIESNSDVWRVAWNATGTVLATSSEDGTLALWRKDYNGEWKSVQTLAVGVINGNEETRAFYRI